MTNEWEQRMNQAPIDGLTGRIIWELKGELTLSLLLQGGGGIATYFELARFLDHPSQVDSMISNSSDAGFARNRIKKIGYYTDVFWGAYTPEDLEIYFREHRLPLPPGYKEEFNRLNSLDNSP